MAAPGIIVQARLGSTRLPGKVLLPVQGKSLLGHLIARLARVERADLVIVATSDRPADRAVAEEADRHGASTFRGSEQDVLARYLAAAERFGVDPVVRITADCPLADPQVIDLAIGRFLDLIELGSAADAVTNTRMGHRTFPRGLDVEVVSRAALDRADARLAREAPQREHVTQLLYECPTEFRIDDLRLPLDLSWLRWTVDTGADFDLVREIYDAVYPTNARFGMEEVLRLLGKRPELQGLNAHVAQKPMPFPRSGATTSV